MDRLREYAVGVIAAAMLIGVLLRLTQVGGSREIIRILCGIFMTVVLIQPIIGKKEIRWESFLRDFTRQAEGITAEGTAAADNIRREIIKQRTEAYIISRAEAVGADIQASVLLGDDCVPVNVRITGSISPLNRSNLAQIIASDLGIPKERQEWTG